MQHATCAAAGKPAAPLTHLTEPRIATSRLLNIAIVGFGNFGQFLAARSVQQPPDCAQCTAGGVRRATHSPPTSATHHTTNNVHAAYTSLDIYRPVSLHWVMRSQSVLLVECARALEYRCEHDYSACSSNAMAHPSVPLRCQQLNGFTVCLFALGLGSAGKAIRSLHSRAQTTRRCECSKADSHLADSHLADSHLADSQPIPT